MKNTDVYSEYTQEGWEVEGDHVWAYGEKFPLVKPLAIHLKNYRNNPSEEFRYQAMFRAFCLLWPDQILTYNYWMERIFREHVNHDTEIFTAAGGAGIGKTQTFAYVGGIFQISNPLKNTTIVASTELASLKNRIYGYLLRAVQEARVPFSWSISNSPPPSIRLNSDDFIHGIYGVAAKAGDDEKTIKSIIGRHPLNSILVILDEATDMPVAIIGALPNLKKGLAGRFQCAAIGNSNSKNDLHGSLSTPLDGWENIDPRKDFRWVTTQPGGVCLYFNPYDSPAIVETNPVKKAALGKFLMTEEKIVKAEREEGIDSEAFWRFTMGYWKDSSTENTIVSEAFLKDYDPTTPAEFSGRENLVICAGLDPAFSVGGDKCILRLAVLGEHVNGYRVLDFKGQHFIYEIKIRANTGKSAEIQIADQVIDILERYGVRLDTLCVDASGQGRGLADVIQLRSGTGLTPTKIYSTNIGNRNVKAFDVVISSAFEMWSKGRDFINQRQIFGMDALSYGQLHTRLFFEKSGKKSLEKKDEYKKRMAATSSLLGRSPDECDASMLCLQSAIIHHGFYAGQKRAAPMFETPDQRLIMEAATAYKEKFIQFRPTLRGNYKGTIASIINKKMF